MEVAVLRKMQSKDREPLLVYSWSFLDSPKGALGSCDCSDDSWGMLLFSFEADMQGIILLLRSKTAT